MGTPSTRIFNDVTWPVQPLDTTRHDMADSLVSLLVQLSINPIPGETAAHGETPASVAIIEAGATEAAKGLSTLLKVVGGGGVVAAALGAFWSNLESSHRIVIMAGAALVIATCVLAIAMVVSADVQARGVGAAAQYEARARIADAYLRGAQSVMKAPEEPSDDVADGLTHLSAQELALAVKELETLRSLMTP